ncbi:MAG: YdeI/OmpD-associated family protein [Asticcacaulis sp.]
MTDTIHPIPDDVRQLLHARGLYARYEERPPYQQNDYMGWIAQANREGTRDRRIQQMLDELESGGLYMKARWKG